MIAVLQRVTGAEVRTEGRIVGKCGKGFCILLGVSGTDTETDAELLATKILKLRVFSDDDGKLNLSCKDIGGEALIVSNFTLLADYRHGNRPDYMKAARPDEAKRLYEYFVTLMKKEIPVGTGSFGAHMALTIENDGPVTIVMNSEELRRK